MNCEPMDVEFIDDQCMTIETTITDYDIQEAMKMDVDIVESEKTTDIVTNIENSQMTDIIEKLLPHLVTRIRRYHELFSQPLIAEFWEETLHNSLKDAGFNTSWKPDRSHKVGEDMRIENVEHSRISCKSGQFVTPRGGQASVKFNGSRTTSQESIEEKIEHLCGDHDDWYFLLAKNKNFDRKYKLLIFESSICKVNKLEWKENESGKQWMGTGVFQASINKSMSAQLWSTLPLHMVSYQHDIIL